MKYNSIDEFLKEMTSPPKEIPTTPVSHSMIQALVRSGVPVISEMAHQSGRIVADVWNDVVDGKISEEVVAQTINKYLNECLELAVKKSQEKK